MKRGGQAKVLVLILAPALLAPALCSASCFRVVDPADPRDPFDLRTDLEEADVVYVGTITASRLERPLPALQARNPRDQPGARLEVEPQIVLKGTPASIPKIISGTEYSDPRLGRFWKFPETYPVSPGDTVLVVGKSDESVFIGHCAASRRWDAETRKTVREVFPSAP